MRLHVVDALVSGRKLREMEVAGSLHLVDVDDLAGVVGKMFGDIEDGIEAGDAEALDRVHACERRGRQAAKDAESFADGLFQSSDQNAPRDGAAFGELGVAVTDVRRSAEP